MKPKVCDMPEQVRAEEARIYAGIREKMIRGHCDRGADAHQCAGAITITRDSITLQCPLCGDARGTLPGSVGR